MIINKYLILHRNGFDYWLKKQKLVITRDDKIYFMLNLQPIIEENLICFDRLDIQDSVYVLSSEKHSFRAKVCVDGNRISYWVDGAIGHLKDIIYFHNSYANISLLRSFDSDYHKFHTDWEKSYSEIKSHISPPQEEKDNKVRTWAMTPQQRTFALRLCYLQEQQNPWFGFSIPGPLPTCSTTFKLPGAKALIINFKNYYADNFNNELPRVFLYDNLVDSYAILDRHYEITKALGYCKEPKVFYDWWNRPILTPNADVYAQFKIFKNGEYRLDFTSENFLDWIINIEEKTDFANFTVLIDGYWFQSEGNYFSVTENIFEGRQSLRKFIDKLHSKNHKVLLWLSHFKINEPFPQGIINEMILENSGNKIKVFDYSFEKVRDYMKNVIRFILSSDDDCLDADGIKLDLGFEIPDCSYSKFFDPGWGVGDQLRSKVNSLIYDCAHSVKPDAFVSDTCVEPSVPLDVIRLNDEWGEHIDIWIERARKAISVKNTIIDMDGFWMHGKKFKNYCMLAPVIGIPSFCCSKKFFSFDLLDEVDYRRLNSSWNVYNHSPVTPDMDIHIDQEENLYYRKYTKGPLAGFYSAISINGHCLVTYTEEKALVASVQKMTIEVPIPSGLKIHKVQALTWENTYETFSYVEGFEKDTILMCVNDVGSWYRWIEIIFE